MQAIWKGLLIGFLKKGLSPTLDINNKVYLFNQIIKNLLSNFIPHKTITLDTLQGQTFSQLKKCCVQKLSQK